MDQAAFNFDSPHLLPDEAAVLACLGHGRESAVSSTEITRRTGLSERKVQQAVQNLRLQHHLILAAVERPFGYFIAQTQDEIVDYTMSLMSRAVKELKVVSLLRRETLRMVFDQAVLNQEGEP